MSMRDRLIRLAAFKLLLDEIGAAQAREKVELMEDVGGRMGAAAAVVDGHEIGTVTIGEGRYPRGTVDGWGVIDEAAFLEWVRKHRPNAVIEVVRESDRKQILGSIEGIAAKGGEIPDGVVEVERGDDYVVVNQSDEQRLNAIRAWREGHLTMPGMDPQIEEGSDG